METLVQNGVSQEWARAVPLTPLCVICPPCPSVHWARSSGVSRPMLTSAYTMYVCILIARNKFPDLVECRTFWLHVQECVLDKILSRKYKQSLRSYYSRLVGIRALFGVFSIGI